MIELMLVVAIIGILAALALPAWRDYATRAKVSELILSTTPAKTAVAEAAQINGTITGSGLNVGAPAIVGFVTGSSVSTDGVITASSTVAAIGTDITVKLAPTAIAADGKLTWRCSVGVPSNYRFVPPDCRN